LPKRVDRAGGFTLLEVLVAFLIGGLALAALTDGARQALRAGRVSGQTEEALARARSRLAAVLVQGALQPLDQQGDDGHGFQWFIRVTPVAAAPVATLYEVRVAVAWPGGTDAPRRVELVTRQLGPAVR
jgi:Tfp pilus assembly protein PilV